MRSQYKNPPLNTVDKRIRGLVGTEGMLGVDLEALEYLILAFTVKEVFGDGIMWDNHHAGVCPKQWTLDALGPLQDYMELREGETKESKAKTLNYAYLYGAGIPHLMGFLNLPSGKAGELQEALNKRFPSLDKLSRQLVRHKRSGTILNLFGQKIKSEDHLVLNSYAQSSGAGYAMRIFTCLSKELDEYYSPIIFNHDEIQYIPKETDIPTEFIDNAIDLAYKNFSDKYNLPIISKFNWTLGNSWKESH